MNAKEIFIKARRLYRRSHNPRYQTPILYDELYTRSGRNGSYDPEGTNPDKIAARMMAVPLANGDLNRLSYIQSHLFRKSTPQPIISSPRRDYMINHDRVAARRQLKMEVFNLRIKKHFAIYQFNLPTPKLPK